MVVKDGVRKICRVNVSTGGRMEGQKQIEVKISSFRELRERL